MKKRSLSKQHYTALTRRELFIVTRAEWHWFNQTEPNVQSKPAIIITEIMQKTVKKSLNPRDVFQESLTLDTRRSFRKSFCPTQSSRFPYSNSSLTSPVIIYCTLHDAQKSTCCWVSSHTGFGLRHPPWRVRRIGLLCLNSAAKFTHNFPYQYDYLIIILLQLNNILNKPL